MLRTMIRARPSHAVLAAVFAVMSASLGGCSGTGANSDARETALNARQLYDGIDKTLTGGTSKPTPEAALTPASKATLGPAAMRVDESRIAPAVAAFAAQKRQTAGQYVTAAADLNGDGRPEVLVLFTSASWCAPQGCPLVVFQDGSFGLKPVSQINRVRPPVRVADTTTAGWRDLWAQTGRDSTDAKKKWANHVRLQFGGNGYPNAATFAIGSTKGEPAGRVLIEQAALELPEKSQSAPFGRDKSAKR
jgi:hypothetical protein